MFSEIAREVIPTGPPLRPNFSVCAHVDVSHPRSNSGGRRLDHKATKLPTNSTTADAPKMPTLWQLDHAPLPSSMRKAKWHQSGVNHRQGWYGSHVSGLFQHFRLDHAGISF